MIGFRRFSGSGVPFVKWTFVRTEFFGFLLRRVPKTKFGLEQFHDGNPFRIQTFRFDHIVMDNYDFVRV